MRTLLLVLAATGLAACEEAPTIDSLDPFLCTQDLCPKDACKVQVVFADSCSGQVAAAEVLINHAIEPGTAAHGSTFESFADIPAHVTSCGSEAECIPGMICQDFVCTNEVFVRSEKWQWGPFNPVCEAAGIPVKLPTLSCKAVGIPASEQ